MHDAGLHHGLRKDGGDRVREALEAIDDGHQDIGNASGFELVHDPEPEFGTLRLLDPTNTTASTTRSSCQLLQTFRSEIENRLFAQTSGDDRVLTKAIVERMAFQRLT